MDIILKMTMQHGLRIIFETELSHKTGGGLQILDFGLRILDF